MKNLKLRFLIIKNVFQHELILQAKAY